MRTQRKSGNNAKLKCIRANIKSLSLWLVSGGYIDVMWAPQGLGTPSCGFTGARKPISWTNYCLKISLENSHVSGISNDVAFGGVSGSYCRSIASFPWHAQWFEWEWPCPFGSHIWRLGPRWWNYVGRVRSCALVGERVSLGVDVEV